MINENKISAMKYRDEIQDIAGKIYRHLFDAQNNENYSKDFTMKSNPNVYITLCGQKTYKIQYGDGNSVFSSDGTCGFYDPEGDSIY